MDLEWERKVHEIVLLAQEKLPSELAAFLDSACQDDPTVRLEVEKRLQGIRQVLDNMRKLLE